MLVFYHQITSKLLRDISCLHIDIRVCAVYDNCSSVILSPELSIGWEQHCVRLWKKRKKIIFTCRWWHANVQYDSAGWRRKISELFKDIVRILGAFHQQMSCIYAIYGMTDTLVTAGVVVEGSVGQALRGKHHRRGMLCIQLWREALMQKRLTYILEHEELSDDIKKNLDVLRNALIETQFYGKLTAI